MFLPKSQSAGLRTTRGVDTGSCDGPSSTFAFLASGSSLTHDSRFADAIEEAIFDFPVLERVLCTNSSIWDRALWMVAMPKDTCNI